MVCSLMLHLPLLSIRRCGWRATARRCRSARRWPLGIAYLTTKEIDLVPGTWTDTTLELTLANAGVYALEGNVRGRLVGDPPMNAFIVARLWDDTAGAALPESERLVYQTIGDADTGQGAGNGTAPISHIFRKAPSAAPTRLRLQAMPVNSVGTARVAQIVSDDSGFTSLRLHWAGI